MFCHGERCSLVASKIEENGTHPGLIDNCKSDWFHLSQFCDYHAPIP